MIAFASSLDQAGPLARDVRDAALALSVLAGADPLDATCARCPVPDYQAACDRGIAGVRIGIHRPALEGPGVDADVRRRCEAALEVLRARGAVIVEIELPHFRYAVAAYYVICTAEASSNLARYDGLRYGPRGVGSELDAVVRAARSAGFGAEVKRRVMLGTFVLRADSYERYYGRAMRVRARIADDYRRAFERCDVLASPTFPIAGFRRGERIDDPLALYLADAFTVGPSLAGLPAISIPAGFSSGPPELPIGLQLVGRSFDEETILAVAAAHEADTSWHARRPPEVS
jgi:aspartyl-tRNA(Asn)/glutamyl-tRNA(Gln) amidotransferase subunit A